MGFDLGLDSGQRALRASASRRRRRSSSAALNCLGMPLAMRPRAAAAELGIEILQWLPNDLTIHHRGYLHVVGVENSAKRRAIFRVEQPRYCICCGAIARYGIARECAKTIIVRECFECHVRLPLFSLASPIARLIG